MKKSCIIGFLLMSFMASGCAAQSNTTSSASQAATSAKTSIAIPDGIITPVQPAQKSPTRSEELSSGALKPCIEETDQTKVFPCLEKFFKDEVTSNNPELAFQDLKAIYDTVPATKIYCHPLAHAIGHAAVTKYTTLSEAYLHGDNFCWSGYYHGAMEEISERIGAKNLPQKLNTICADIPGKASYSFDYYNCVHGLGHGVMAVTGDQLFESLKMCDKLKGNWEMESCYSGVFMENIIIDNFNHHTDYLKPAEPLYPCNIVATKYKMPCYLMQTSYMLKLTSYDFKKVFDQCKKADKDFISICYQSLGRDASGSNASDIEKTHGTCSLGEDFNQKSNCIIGAVKDFISYFHSDVQAKQFCTSFDDKKLSDLCLDTATDYYKSF